ncbi:hypothetical protein F5880DRAFT_1477744, partial [Lentinula raphanica]
STEEESKLKEWLAAPDCSTNYTAALNKRVAGTGQWIFEDPTYLEWKKEGSILWIHGKAGSGKTFLITSIIDNLETMDCSSCSSLVIYHYFDIRDNIGTKLSFQGLLSSLLMQLGAQDQKIHPALKNLHRSSKHGLSQVKSTDLKLMETVTEIIKDLVQKKIQIYIMIDALDECKDASSVMEFIDEITSFPLVKTIISSRSYSPENHKYFTISLSSNKMVDEDIVIFMEKQITFKNTKLKAEVKELFRFIDCQVQSLKRCTNTKGVHRALAQLPLDLNGIYTEAIEKCQMSSHSEDAHHVLLWLLYSLEPLYLDQIAIILSIDLNLLTIEPDTEMLVSIEEIVDTTLITIDNKNIVQLAHASVKEFLLKNPNDLHTRILFDLNAQLAHNTIAQMCLIYLSNENDIETPRFDFQYTVKNTTFGQYATQYWIQHSQHSEWAEIPCEKTMKLIWEFLMNNPIPFEDWKQKYNYKFHPWLSQSATFKGCNPLQVVAFCDLETTMERLLMDMKTDSSTTSNNILKAGNIGPAIQGAAAHGNWRIVKLLIDHGADINVKGGFHGTAIQAAALSGHTDIIEYLIEHGADVNAQAGEYGTVIEAAALHGYEDIVEYLIEHGKYGTAIEAAALNGHKDIVGYLIEHGANVNAQGGKYGTAIEAAALNGFEDIVEFLTEHGADVNAQAGKLGTAIEAAAFNGIRKNTPDQGSFKDTRDSLKSPKSLKRFKATRLSELFGKRAQNLVSLKFSRIVPGLFKSNSEISKML